MKQMVLPGSSRAKRSVRRRRCQAALAACALSAFGACSVYDASLLNGSAGLQGHAGANAANVGGSGSGGVPQSATAGEGTLSGTGGSSTAVSQGGASDGGSAGESGNGDSPGAGGSLANGGTDASLGGSISGAPGGGTSGTANGGAASGGAASGGAASGGAGGGGAGNANGGAVNGHSGGTTSAGNTSFAGTASQTLAVLKLADASSTQPGNEPSHGNDNNMTSRWCASGPEFPQWWRVDLGAVHLLSAAAVQFEHPDHFYTYTIETSQDNLAFAVQAGQTARGMVQTVPFPTPVIARYVRITITKGTPQVPNDQTWASIIEFSVTGR